MALISCPECMHDISDKAKHCIHCGFPLLEHLLEQEKVARATSTGESFASKETAPAVAGAGGVKRCGKCFEQLRADGVCEYCTRKETSKSTVVNPAASFQKAKSQYELEEGDFFSELIAGNKGLAKTYWLYNVLPGFLLSLIARSVENNFILLILSVVSLIPIVAVWNAADKYTGWVGWKFFAKLSCVLGVIAFVLSVVALFVLNSSAPNY